MRVIFLKTAKGIGKQGDVKEVSDGYAQNFLIPKGIAQRATDESVALVEHEKKLQQQQETVRKQELENLLNTLQKTKQVLITGSLYQAISAQEICNEIHKQHHIFIPKNLLFDYEPIKGKGTFKITVGTKDVSIVYTVTVHE